MSGLTSKHLQLAERGMRLALAGRHGAAIACYRDALREAGRTGANLIVLRHYSECLLESLELLGAYEQVVACCDAALEHYAGKPPPSILAWRDVANIHLRRAAVNAKRGCVPEALTDCTCALDAALRAGTSLPLAEDLRRWLSAGLTVDAARITQQQRHRQYFAVRSDSLRLHGARSAPPAQP